MEKQPVKEKEKCVYSINTTKETRELADELVRKLDRSRSWIFEQAMKDYYRKIKKDAA